MARSRFQEGPARDHYHIALGPSQAPGGAGVTLDNTVDPPAEVTTLIAEGATISGDEGTLAAGGGEMLRATVVLTDAQVKALGSGAGGTQTLVAAPGAGKSLRLWALDFIAVIVGGYTNLGADGVLTIRYNGGAEVAWLPNDTGEGRTELTDLLGAVATNVLRVVPGALISAAYGPYFQVQADQGEANKALALQGAGGAYTGGNASNSLTITTYYSVLDL